jgi:hypothetical protein
VIRPRNGKRWRQCLCGGHIDLCHLSASAAPLFEFETASFLSSQTFSQTLRRIVVPEWDIDIPEKFQPFSDSGGIRQGAIDPGRQSGCPYTSRPVTEGSRQLSRNSVCSRFYFQRVLTTRMENFEPAQHAYFSVEYSRTKLTGSAETQVTEEPSEQVGSGAPPAPTKTHPNVQQKDKGGEKVAITPRPGSCRMGAPRKP